MTASQRVASNPGPTDTAVSAVPLTPVIGALVKGVDLATLDDATFETLHKLIDEHSVVVLRDQHLTSEQQVAFAERLGAIYTQKYHKDNNFSVPGFPQLAVVSNIVENGRNIGMMDAGLLWHTDGSFLRTPTMYTMLYALEVPERDGKVLGDTLFVNTAAAFEALPPAEQKRLTGMRALHSYVFHIEKKRARGNLKRPPLTDAQRSAVPDVDHPVVRTHPRTGRKSLFVSDGHTSQIVGMSQEESDEMLHSLWDHIQSPRFMMRHSWKVGDVVIWDNCVTQHLAQFDYGDIRRRLHRASTVSAVPA